MDNQKIIKITLLVLGALFIFWVVYLLIPKAYVKFSTAPDQVVALIDNGRHVIKNGDTLTIAPGKHDIVVFEDEFNPQEETVDIKNGETYNFVAPLIALTENAKKRLNNSDSDKVLEQATGISEAKASSIVDKIYPIMNALPIRGRNYTISSCPSVKSPDNPLKSALCIDLYPPRYDRNADVRSDALNDLRARGFNPDSYEIIWNTIII